MAERIAAFDDLKDLFPASRCYFDSAHHGLVDPSISLMVSRRSIGVKTK